MQGKFCGVDAVDEAAKHAADPVARVAEAGLAGHVRARCADACLLVDGLDLSSIELERLRRLSTEDEHISVVQLYASNGLRSDELHVVHFKLGPLLAGHRCTIVSVAPVALVNLR